ILLPFLESSLVPRWKPSPSLSPSQLRSQRQSGPNSNFFSLNRPYYTRPEDFSIPSYTPPKPGESRERTFVPPSTLHNSSLGFFPPPSHISPPSSKPRFQYPQSFPYPYPSPSSTEGPTPPPFTTTDNIHGEYSTPNDLHSTVSSPSPTTTIGPTRPSNHYSTPPETSGKTNPSELPYPTQSSSRIPSSKTLSPYFTGNHPSPAHYRTPDNARPSYSNPSPSRGYSTPTLTSPLYPTLSPTNAYHEENHNTNTYNTPGRGYSSSYDTTPTGSIEYSTPKGQDYSTPSSGITKPQIITAAPGDYGSSIGDYGSSPDTRYPSKPSTVSSGMSSPPAHIPPYFTGYSTPSRPLSPSGEYVPSGPSTPGYGTPSRPSGPSGEYGPSGPSTPGYGTPSRPSGEYGPSGPSTPGYGTPSRPSGPSGEYGPSVPSTPGYGTPSRPSGPSGEYGPSGPSTPGYSTTSRPSGPSGEYVPAGPSTPGYGTPSRPSGPSAEYGEIPTKSPSTVIPSSGPFPPPSSGIYSVDCIDCTPKPSNLSIYSPPRGGPKFIIHNQTGSPAPPASNPYSFFSTVPPGDQSTVSYDQPPPPPGSNNETKLIDNRIKGMAHILCIEDGVEVNALTVRPFDGTVATIVDGKRKCVHSFTGSTTNISIFFPFEDCGIKNKKNQANAKWDTQVVFSFPNNDDSFLIQCETQSLKYDKGTLPMRLEESLEEFQLIPIKIEQKAPLPTILWSLTDRNVTEVDIGTQQVMYFNLTPETEAYGFHVKNCFVIDEKNGEHHSVIDRKGCSSDMAAFTHPQYNTFDDTMRSDWMAFKLPDHDSLHISCSYTICPDFPSSSGDNSSVCSTIPAPPLCPRTLATPFNSLTSYQALTKRDAEGENQRVGASLPILDASTISPQFTCITPFSFFLTLSLSSTSILIASTLHVVSRRFHD
ncbi:hypothetical protein PFISCL1PPCAC_19655, partial [Pristionchus fissidentatus]